METCTSKKGRGPWIGSEDGFSTVLVVVISAIVSAVILGIMQMSVYSAQNAERAIAFAQFALLNEQLTIRMRAVGFYAIPTSHNSCTLALTAGGAPQYFDTSPAALNPPNIKIYNGDGTVFLDPTSVNNNRFGRLIINRIYLKSFGQISPVLSPNLFKAQLVIEAQMDAGGTGAPGKFANTANKSQILWLSVSASGTSGMQTVQSCTSNFFSTGPSTDPKPMPVCDMYHEVLYAKEGIPGSGIASDVYCIKALCDSSTPWGNGYTKPSSYDANGQGICP